MHNETRHPRLAIIYPWSDLQHWSSGASLRVNLLLDFLDEYEVDVRVLQSGIESYKRSRTISIEAAQLAKAPFFLRKRVKAVSWFTKEKGFVCAERLKFDQAEVSPEFIEKLHSICAWADIILVKYPFFFHSIKKFKLKNNQKIILSAHDILYDHAVKSRVIRSEIKRREMYAYRHADGVVVVSPSDVIRLKNDGINSVFIPHPARFSIAHPEETGLFCEYVDSMNISMEGKTICFFIGSEYPPNVDAVAQIRRIALEAQKRPQLRDFLFVVAGRCAPAEKDGNFLSLGQVAEHQLKIIYAATKIVLIPLLFGTGSSLKTIEALGAGKIVIGTSIAFRGYNVENRKNCIVEDNFDKYNELLIEFVQNKMFFNKIAKNASEFARKNATIVAFGEYWKLFGIDPEKKMLSDEHQRDQGATEPPMMR